MRHSLTWSIGSLALLLLLPQCSRATGPGGGDTHFLQICVSDADCGDLRCNCGVCTESCEAQGEECVATGGLCLADGCGTGLSCDEPCRQDADCFEARLEFVCQEGRCRYDGDLDKESRSKEQDETDLGSEVDPDPDPDVTPDPDEDDDLGGGEETDELDDLKCDQVIELRPGPEDGQDATVMSLLRSDVDYTDNNWSEVVALRVAQWTGKRASKHRSIIHSF